MDRSITLDEAEQVVELLEDWTQDDASLMPEYSPRRRSRGERYGRLTPDSPTKEHHMTTTAELATEYDTTTEDVDTIIDQLIGLGAVTPDDTGTLPPADWAEVCEALDNSRAVLGHTETRACYVCGTTWTGRVAPDAYQPLPVDTDPETGKLTCESCAYGCKFVY